MSQAMLTLLLMPYQEIIYLSSFHLLHRSLKPSTDRTPSDHQTRLGLARLDQSLSMYFAHGIATSTQAAYLSGQRSYLSFCAKFNLTPLPLSEHTLCRFVAFLASSLSPQTIHSYISAVRHLHISYGFSDPSLSSFVHLSYVLKGIKRVSQPLMRRHRLPITPTILRALHAVWSRHPDRDKVMLWAACCLAFFGFLRAGEFTCPSLSAFSPGMLSREDVAVDSHANPSVMTVTLKHSKTDPFGAGVTIFLGKTGDILCPVSAMLGYLATATSTSGPLFELKCLYRYIKSK